MIILKRYFYLKTEMMPLTYPFVFPSIVKMLFGVFLLCPLFQARSNLKKKEAQERKVSGIT